MKKILVSLVSEQTVPNVTPILHFSPDECWFVSTEKSEENRWG